MIEPIKKVPPLSYWLRLRNKYLKLKNNDSNTAYKKQKNFCVRHLSEVKKQFYENVNVNFVYDNNKILETDKAFLFG